LNPLKIGERPEGKNSFFCYFFKVRENEAIMTTKLTWEEYQRIKDIKILDLEICDFGHLNILNLGWES
jgi:hypothetical protein